MVLDLSEEKNNGVAKLIAEELCDELISFDENTKAEEIHSGKAYIFVVDCKSVSAKLARNFIDTQFTGSKVLYCLFLSAVHSDEIDTIAKTVSAAKGFVLFGYDNLSIDSQGFIADGERVRLNSALQRIKDYRPFESETFPYNA